RDVPRSPSYICSDVLHPASRSFSFFFFSIIRPPLPPTLFPYTTLFRSTMVLDEPTNHLDADSIIWLRDYLKNYSGGLMIIRPPLDRKSTRLNSSHVSISYAVFCLKKKRKTNWRQSRRKE